MKTSSVAFVQGEPGTMLEEAELRNFIAERLAPYKRPTQIMLMESLPATASGKILKGRLRDG
ncbi:hypothetical protein R5M92_05025 [Halomonas sp. Bachu 37]|uniref:AMP-binding enzyme n=1 Tax=Halomonas kashgarensis TaxID=3084920 RepID=UPI0032170544